MIAGDAVVLCPPVTIQKVEQDRVLVDFRVGKRLLPRDVEGVAVDHLEPPLKDETIIAASVQHHAVFRFGVRPHLLQIGQKGLPDPVDLLDRYQAFEEHITVDTKLCQLQIEVIIG